jgi:hypothetical protein
VAREAVRRRSLGMEHRNAWRRIGSFWLCEPRDANLCLLVEPCLLRCLALRP